MGIKGRTLQDRRIQKKERGRRSGRKSTVCLIIISSECNPLNTKEWRTQSVLDGDGKGSQVMSGSRFSENGGNPPTRGRNKKPKKRLNLDGM